MLWYNDVVANPVLPRPQHYGSAGVDGKLQPVMTTLAPAPAAVIDLVKCGYIESPCENNRCKCRRSGLNCTALCSCSIESDACNNTGNVSLSDDEDDSDNELQSVCI